MNEEIYCGSLCVKYILDYLKIKYKLDNKMIWVTELAMSLKNQTNKKVKVCYYNSKLVKEYYAFPISSFEGFRHISDYLNSNGELKEKKLTKTNLKIEIDSSDFVILCVKSSKFNNDKKMSGGHFIILKQRKGNLVNVINPQKNTYIVQNIKIGKLIKCAKNYGSWRILFNEKI